MFATDDSLPPDLTLIFNVKKSALDEAAGVHGDVVHVQTHSLLLALASCTMRHIIELQPRVEGRLEVKMPADEDPAGWAEVVERLIAPFKPASERPVWTAAAVERVLPVAHKHNMQGLLSECTAWCTSVSLSPNEHDPHYVVRWLMIAEAHQLDGVRDRCRSWIAHWPLSTIKGHPMYVLDWLAVAEAHNWEWLREHCLAWLSSGAAGPAPPSPADLSSGKLGALRMVLEDEAGCARLSVATVLSLARSLAGGVSALDGATAAVGVAGCALCGARMALFRGHGGPLAARAGRVPSLPDARWVVSGVACPCGGVISTKSLVQRPGASGAVGHGGLYGGAWLGSGAVGSWGAAGVPPSLLPLLQHGGSSGNLAAAATDGGAGGSSGGAGSGAAGTSAGGAAVGGFRYPGSSSVPGPSGSSACFQQGHAAAPAPVIHLVPAAGPGIGAAAVAAAELEDLRQRFLRLR